MVPGRIMPLHAHDGHVGPVRHRPAYSPPRGPYPGSHTSHYHDHGYGHPSPKRHRGPRPDEYDIPPPGRRGAIPPGAPNYAGPRGYDPRHEPVARPPGQGAPPWHADPRYVVHAPPPSSHHAPPGPHHTSLSRPMRGSWEPDYVDSHHPSPAHLPQTAILVQAGAEGKYDANAPSARPMVKANSPGPANRPGRKRSGFSPAVEPYVQEVDMGRQRRSGFSPPIVGQPAAAAVAAPAVAIQIPALGGQPIGAAAASQVLQPTITSSHMYAPSSAAAPVPSSLLAPTILTMSLAGPGGGSVIRPGLPTMLTPLSAPMSGMVLSAGGAMQAIAGHQLQLQQPQPQAAPAFVSMNGMPASGQMNIAGGAGMGGTIGGMSINQGVAQPKPAQIHAIPTTAVTVVDDLPQRIAAAKTPTEILQLAVARGSGIDTQHLSLALWQIAILQNKGGVMEAGNPQLHELVALCRGRAANMGPKQLAEVVWALAQV